MDESKAESKWTSLVIGRQKGHALHMAYSDDGRGRPVVLVHGWPLASRCWAALRGLFLAAGYRVICYDRRGYGRSTRTDIGLDFDTFAEDLHLLLETLALHSATLIGHGMGAGVVLRYLGTYGDRVTQAVLLGALAPMPWDLPDVEARVLRTSRSINQYRSARPSYLERYLQAMFDDAHDVADWWPLALEDSEATSGDLLATRNADFSDDLRRIEAQTLLVHGRNDRIAPPETSAHVLMQHLPACRLACIDGAGHGLPLTHAEETGALILAFLNQFSLRVCSTSQLRTT